MKNSALWICLAMLLTSVASAIEFQNHMQKWRYQFSMIASIIFFFLFLLGLVSLGRNKKMGR
jgi:hypothetical protein